MHAVIYADDISPINPSSIETNLALESIAREGSFNGNKFKPSTCKIVGVDPVDNAVFRLGGRTVDRAKLGLLLGAVIGRDGIHLEEHVSRRASMVNTAISQMNSWRTRGLPYDIVYKHLFKAKLLPRFVYAFAWLPSRNWGIAHN